MKIIKCPRCEQMSISYSAWPTLNVIWNGPCEYKLNEHNHIKQMPNCFSISRRIASKLNIILKNIDKTNIKYNIIYKKGRIGGYTTLNDTPSDDANTTTFMIYDTKQYRNPMTKEVSPNTNEQTE